MVNGKQILEFRVLDDPNAGKEKTIPVFVASRNGPLVQLHPLANKALYLRMSLEDIDKKNLRKLN